MNEAFHPPKRLRWVQELRSGTLLFEVYSTWDYIVLKGRRRGPYFEKLPDVL